MTFPEPHNPDKLSPPAPGYRYIGLSEIRKATDEYFLNHEAWVRTLGSGMRPLDRTYRRAICIDDPLAPPPAQWTEDYEVFKPAPNHPEIERGTGTDWQAWFQGKWCPVVSGVSAGPWWYRRPKFSKHGIPSEYAADYPIIRRVKKGDNPKPNDKAMWVDGVWIRVGQNAPYAMGGWVGCEEEKADSKPVLKPDQSFAIITHGSCPISSAIQELAFAAGYHWNSYSPNNPAGCKVQMAQTEVLHLSPHKTITYSRLSEMTAAKSSLVLDAKTDLGQIMDLLVAIKAPPALVINGHAAEYTNGHASIIFGCAKLSIPMLRIAYEIMKDQYVGINRTVASITLSSGVKLDKTEIESILSYVEKLGAFPSYTKMDQHLKVGKPAS